MDIQTIDQAYNQLQTQAGQSTQALQILAGKLQTAAGNGDTQAREWLLDLREVALSFQAEQQQVTALLQAIHNSVMQESGAAAPEISTQPAQAQPQSSGFFSNLLNSGFGQAVASGAGFGIGDDLVKKIF
ncbi:hypothetical protein [Acetobacter oeni]|uniref:Uncharacterized protein n=1 Tax=Acetobacter oeni TaxID=304077 RepID=A0A511XLW4_9PROT|nr:hypothetical protein [Acetobacter oeni]MBB3882949.1 uncharacterized protein YhaN [Acetobacter oeni]NHO19031.1 hypothetical protein [Acetobacter oeni]GBR09292.1 hypothetical protein AA21952_2817 [Acetobacter oeni LMG 21952]GEN63929.1 hypothetical protein AOE01nite_21530 [Acetobacter oeni]